jgi:hypothetical protein
MNMSRINMDDLKAEQSYGGATLNVGTNIGIGLIAIANAIHRLIDYWDKQEDPVDDDESDIEEDFGDIEE